eukprot:gene6321-10328_t
MNTQWFSQWLSSTLQQQRESWIISTPKFKYCKKRKEFFTDDFTDTWYKSPYKYHMLLTTYNVPSEVSVKLTLIYEDGTKVEDENPVTITETTITKLKGTEEHQHVIGPFQFNVCSYKHEGRKFKVQVSLVLDEKIIYQMNSPSFIIKAKKPISKPGLKNKKRKREDETEEEEEETEEEIKRRKVELLKERSYLFSPLAPKIPLPLNFRQLLPSNPSNSMPKSNVIVPNFIQPSTFMKQLQTTETTSPRNTQPKTVPKKEIVVVSNEVTSTPQTSLLQQQQQQSNEFNFVMNNFDQYFEPQQSQNNDELFGDFLQNSFQNIKVEEDILNQFDQLNDAERLETMENLMDSNKFEDMNFCKFEKDTDYLFDNDVDQFFIL